MSLCTYLANKDSQICLKIGLWVKELVWFRFTPRALHLASLNVYVYANVWHSCMQSAFLIQNMFPNVLDV